MNDKIRMSIENEEKNLVKSTEIMKHSNFLLRSSIHNSFKFFLFSKGVPTSTFFYNLIILWLAMCDIKQSHSHKKKTKKKKTDWQYYFLE